MTMFSVEPSVYIYVYRMHGGAGAIQIWILHIQSEADVHEARTLQVKTSYLPIIFNFLTQACVNTYDNVAT